MKEKTEQFKSWLLHHHSRLVRISRFYERDPEAQRDLYQDILLEVWKSLDRFKGQADFGTWGYRIAVNTAISHVRKDQRRKKPGLGPQSIQFDPDWPEKLDQDQRLQALYSAIADLKDLDRSVVMLYLEELSYAEIAEVTGMTENQVGVRLHRLKQKLIQKLNPTHHE